MSSAYVKEALVQTEIEMSSTVNQVSGWDLLLACDLDRFSPTCFTPSSQVYDYLKLEKVDGQQNKN